ncbi:MAG TPA: hypothetical protein VGH36_07975 [Acetobacteraceae bacterium]
MQAVAHRAPNPMTTALAIALNDMFDKASAQQFAFESDLPAELLLALYVGALLTIGAEGYQFGVADKRQGVLSSLLLLMWTGGMLLIIDLSEPRMGDIRVAEPLIWTIQGFNPK